MIHYQALYRNDRQSKKLRLAGHVWVCDGLYCERLVHDEPLVGPDETVEQQAERVARINTALSSHVCPDRAAPREDPPGLAGSEAPCSSPDPASAPDEETT